MKNIISLIILLTAFRNIMPQNETNQIDAAMFSKANQLAQTYPIVDTHIDLPSWLYDEWFDVSQVSNGGEFDYIRAIEGGLNVAFMSIYTSPSLEGTGNLRLGRIP